MCSHKLPLPFLRFFSFNYKANVWVGGATPTALTVSRLGYLNYFNAFFGLSRGGYCLDCVPYGDMTQTAFLDNASSIDSVSLVGETRSALHVKIPYYNRRTRDAVFSARTALGPPASVTVCFSKAAGTTAKSIIFCRAADDFQLGYFLGAPPLAHDFVAAPPDGVSIAGLLCVDH